MRCVCRAQMEILWKEFRKCFPNEGLALTAAERNSNVFNPQLNSPTKIKVSKRTDGAPASKSWLVKNAHARSRRVAGHQRAAPEALWQKGRAGGHQQESRCAHLLAHEP